VSPSAACSPVRGLHAPTSGSRSLAGVCGLRSATTCVPPPPRQPLLICNFYYCYFVFVLLFLFSGLGFRLPTPVEIDLVVVSFIFGFPSSVTVLLRLLAVFVQQQLSFNGCCFYWLGLFEPFCHFIPLHAVLEKARLICDFSGIIGDNHCLLLLCTCVLLPFLLWFSWYGEPTPFFFFRISNFFFLSDQEW
jgi:hypothetical protein